MGIKNDCRKNTEGYSDPTAYEALRNIEQEEDRFHKLLETIFTLCELLQIGTSFWSGDYAMVQKDGKIQKVSLKRIYDVREV